MRPNVFITEEFLDELGNAIPKVVNLIDDSVESENKLESCKRIRNLLLSSNLKCSILDKKLVKFYKTGLDECPNLKSLIIKRAIKETRLKNNESYNDFQEKNNIYLIKEDINECNNLSKKKGVIILGKNFIQQPFFLQHSFPPIKTDAGINSIDESIHPCSGMIIMDPYIFIDNNNRPPKIPNLINFLNKFAQFVDPCFELDIITNNPENNELIDLKYNQILESFKNDNINISLHIYAPYRSITDRHFITNYALYSIGHPFDRDSYISGNFYPSSDTKENVKRNYKELHEKILEAIEIINNTPDKVGLINCVWKTDQTQHAIFNRF